MLRPMTLIAVFGLIATVSAPNTVIAQGYVYPSKNQSPEQQRRDDYECHAWAIQQTGVDPSRPAPNYQQSQPSGRRRGGLFRGAARCAAVGAVGGAIAGNAGRGAAIGAGIGALGGSIRRHEYNRQQQYAAEATRSQDAARQAEYQRAKAACLQGRGYTVR